MRTKLNHLLLLVSAAAITVTILPITAMADEEQGPAQRGQVSALTTADVSEQQPAGTSASVQHQKTGDTSQTAATQPNPTPAANTKNGLILKDGHLINYADGAEKAISGWQKFEGSWYWFANSSRASESAWVEDAGNKYRVGSDGKMVIGSFTVDGSLYYASDSGAIVVGNGWAKCGDKWFYTTNSGALRTGWVNASGKWYWMDKKTGVMKTGWLKDDDGNWYLLDGSGAMLTGWQQVGSWYYLNDSGAMATGWLQSSGAWYWLDKKSGAMSVGRIQDDNGKWWYAESSGALATSSHWAKEANNTWYWVDADGSVATGWRNVSGTWYWLDPTHSGKMSADELINDNGTYYWASSSGAMARNAWCKDSNWHWASDSGAMASGWLNTSGEWYWLDPSTPEHPMLTGLQTVNGQDYFLSTSGAMLSSCWATIDTEGNSRFAAKSGALGKITKKSDGTLLDENGEPCSGFVSLGDGYQTYADPSTHTVKRGWIKDGDAYYYLDPSTEILTTGWSKIDGTWYYFSTEAKMQTGWYKVDGSWYYSNESGAMQTGWLKTGETWYYLNPSGAMATGWKQIGGTWYYMDNSGAMQTGWYKVGSTWYYSNNSGAMQTGWLQQGSTWYWLDGSGAMATGWRSIDGTWYYFNDSGAWVPNPERAEMANRIGGYSSGTKWLIGVDRSAHKVGIFNGYANHWSLWYFVDCVTGAPSSPTITGTFHTTGYTRTCLSTDSRARWATQINGGYFFHTILNSNDELGKSLSHGCIRLSYPDAQWIYNNIYAGTTVVIYN